MISHAEPHFRVSHRSDGNMSYVYGSEEEVSNNRARFVSRCDISPKQTTAAHLAGSSRIHEVGKKDWGKGMFGSEDAIDADTLVTRELGTSLFINVADCLAIGFFDKRNMALALTHAGYYGVSKHMPRHTIEWMMRHYGTDPKDLLVRVSPAIHKESFVFHDRSLFKESHWDNYLLYKEGVGYFADWIRFALDEIIKCGVKEAHIQQSHFNTYTNHYFFSHQRQVEQGELEEPEHGNHGVVASFDFTKK